MSSLLSCLLLEWHSLLKSVILGFSHFQLNIRLTNRIHMKVCLKSCLRWSVAHRTSLMSWDLQVNKHLHDWTTDNPELRDRLYYYYFILQFSSVIQSCPTLCDPMNCSMPGLPVHHQLLEFTQTHVHRVGDAIQPSHPLSSPSPLSSNLLKHQGLFQWVSSSHEVAKVLEFQLQHQSFQWTLRTDLL